ncbi:hypothetical protein BP6252_03612 [Coleophoma cylindrospora]|uniref:Uncharacterized protein n=1 Tax=Coleophoma cylindrospora TaxID=1849047 RepID=A0A3D8S8F8_9HELO|nr:hypothetical protein BP6252_03612 [Coleophoma cylindrospora]
MSYQHYAERPAIIHSRNSSASSRSSANSYTQQSDRSSMGTGNHSSTGGLTTQCYRVPNDRQKEIEATTRVNQSGRSVTVINHRQGGYEAAAPRTAMATQSNFYSPRRDDRQPRRSS